MGIIGEQFGRPSGLLGTLAGRFMARNNAAFNRWVCAEAVASLTGAPTSIVEVGSGPGIGTQALLAAVPSARVTAVDPSAPMQRQLHRRNRSAVAAGRLRAVTGDLTAVADQSEVDLVVAVHVLYFWHTPARELDVVRGLLRSGGVFALGYQLRQHMPPVAQRDFPASGHVLYDSDEDVIGLLSSAGLSSLPVRTLGPEESPAGRLLLATPA